MAKFNSDISYEKIVQLYNEGESIEYIAYALGTKPSVVRYILSEKVSIREASSSTHKFYGIILFILICAFGPFASYQTFLRGEENYLLIGFLVQLIALWGVSVILLLALVALRNKKKSTIRKKEDAHRLTAAKFLLVLFIIVSLPSMIGFYLDELPREVFFLAVDSDILSTIRKEEIDRYWLVIGGATLGAHMLLFIWFSSILIPIFIPLPAEFKMYLKGEAIIEYADRGYNLDVMEVKLDIPKEKIRDFLFKRDKYDTYKKKVYENAHKILEEESELDSEFKYLRKRRIDNLGNSKFLKKLITHHENRTVEFKASFFTNPKTGQVNATTQHWALKAICGFLNAYGGYLLIGVRDNQEVRGILNDNFSDADTYVRKLETLISNCLGDVATKYIDIRITHFEKGDKLIANNKEYVLDDSLPICAIGVESSKSPVMCRHKDYNKQSRNDTKLPVGHEFFYVRNNNQTKSLTLTDANKYISEHF